MNFTKEKGFTIVELVICIAIIGILTSIFIPVFSGLVMSANETAKQQRLNDAYKDYIFNNASNDNYYQKHELFFNYEECIYGYIDNSYVTILNDSGELISPNNANEYGFVLMSETYNDLMSYYYDKNYKDNSTIKEPSEDELIQVSLSSAYNEFLATFEDSDFYPQEMIIFAKQTSENEFSLYEAVDSNGNFSYVFRGKYSLNEIEDYGFMNLCEDKEFNGFIALIS